MAVLVACHLTNKYACLLGCTRDEREYLLAEKCIFESESAHVRNL